MARADQEERDRQIAVLERLAALEDDPGAKGYTQGQIRNLREGRALYLPHHMDRIEGAVRIREERDAAGGAR